ncbi:MAG TPA: HlyD family type I secretion periplasmic adaptor subunit [Arsenicitalea sp.]|jgi:HlyD family secretion protein|nr:HlyD family type I secretion periplasmic adaptor subunit [Arsenicitalea sp.]
MTRAALAEYQDLKSLSRHAMLALVAIMGLFGGLIYWASTVDIAGAVMGQGTIAVESYAKRVQHQEGGIVKQILARNEDHVTAGQLLVVLDDTSISANLKIVQTQLHEAQAKEARLVAEIDGLGTLVLPPEFKERAADPQFARLILTEQRIMASRKATRDNRVAQLNEQIAQVDRQIEGLALQQAAAEHRLQVLGKEFSDLSSLLKRGLVQASRVNVLDKDKATVEGELGSLIATTAQARASIAERRLQISQVEDDFLTGALGDLQETRRAVTEASEQERAILDKQQRTEVRAPQAGVIHESIVHTVGGVIAPGETLMLVVPQDDKLVVNVRTSPMDVDKISIDQPVTIRLSSFDRSSTPELFAHVSGVSPDLTRDPATGQSYYTTLVSIPDSERARLASSVKLIPGMPVEAFIKTEDRSVLSYLVHPFAEQLARVFRED